MYMKCLSTFICCGKAFGCTLTQAWWFRWGPNFGELGSGGAKMTSWCLCWGCKPPHSASHIHNTCIWSVWAPSYAVERHLGAPLHRHDGSGGGQILENWGQVELKWHHGVFVEAVNHPTVVPGHGDLDILLVILYRRVKVPSVRSILYSTTWWE